MRSKQAWADWRDADAYAPLLAADRSILAWEWLRRDGGYRAAALAALAQKATAGAARPQLWGLETFEDPHAAAPAARPLWRRAVHPAVLAVEAAGVEAAEDAFDLRLLAGLATLVRSEGGAEHLLLFDGLRAIRLDILSGSVANGPVQLRYLLAGLASAEPPLLTLRRFLSLWRRGRFSRALHRPEAKAKRWVLMLRARDALTAGADQREIARVLLSPSAADPRWRSEVPSLRSQAQRLVREARRMAGGGWRRLLL